VTVQPAESKSRPTVLEVLDRIDRDQKARESGALTEEEMAAEIAQMRTEQDC
jgi:hypothetical protein